MFTHEEFFGKFWDLCVEINSEFTYSTIQNKIAEVSQEINLEANDAPTTHLVRQNDSRRYDPTGVCAIVQRVVGVDIASTSAILGTKNQVSYHGGKRKGAGRKSGTKEDRYLEGTFFNVSSG
jgi:hypothetical protein